MSWKYTQVLCIVLLLAATAYLLISHGYRENALNRRIVALEAQNKTLQDDHETRVARLKAQEAAAPRDGQRQTGDPSTLPHGNLLLDMLMKSAAVSGQKPTPLDEFRAAVKLDEAQERSVRSILDEFAEAPGRAFAQAEAEKRFIFDAKSAEMVNDARRIALDRLKSVLTREQYATMIAGGHDDKLGLRIHPPSR